MWSPSEKNLEKKVPLCYTDCNFRIVVLFDGEEIPSLRMEGCDGEPKKGYVAYLHTAD